MRIFLPPQPVSKGYIDPALVHQAVLAKIDFELSDDVWECIDDAFSDYWNNLYGTDERADYNETCRYIYDRLEKAHFLYPFNNVVEIVDAMYDFIEQIPGAFLSD